MSIILRRIGVIGDVHAEATALKAVLTFLQDEASDGPLDALLCTGDVVTGPENAGNTIDLLQKANVQTVRGNHDRWFCRPNSAEYLSLPHATESHELNDEHREWLCSLPITREFDTERGPLLLCPRNPNQ